MKQFSKNLKCFLKKKILRLNDKCLYDIPVNLKDCNFVIFRTNWYVFRFNLFLNRNVGGHNNFQTAHMPSPNSSPQYLMYFGQNKCCDSCRVMSWLVDVPGRDPFIVLWAWWVSLALSRFQMQCIIPCADSCTIICALLPTTP